MTTTTQQTDEQTTQVENEPTATDAVASPDLVAQPTIPIGLLRAHPGNVRSSDPNPEILASVKADGILVPLRVTIDADVPGAVRILDGHQRYAVALALGMSEVPYTFAPDREHDQAGQYLDMVSTARHRTGLTAIQEAMALFAAAEAGASKTRLSKALGGKPKQVAAALAAAGLPEPVKAATTQAEYAWTLDELAALAEFADDEEATARLIEAAGEGQFGYQVERERIERAEQAERAALRSGLEAEGVRVLDADPPQGSTLERLRGADGADLDKDNHRDCPGHVATVARFGRTEVTYWCQSPATYAHSTRWPTGSGGAESAVKKPVDKQQRRLVIEGNKAWKAAAANRRAFLTGLLARTALPREVGEQIARFAAETLLAWPEPIQNPSTGHVRAIQCVLLGVEESSRTDWAQLAAGANSRRALQLTLAPLAACYEYAAREKVWRVDLDAWELHARPHARRWLRLCEAIGHTLSPIERAVAEDHAVTLGDLGLQTHESDAPADEDESHDQGTDDPDRPEHSADRS